MRCVYEPNIECNGCLACKEEVIYCERCGERIINDYYEIRGFTLCEQCMQDCKVEFDA